MNVERVHLPRVYAIFERTSHMYRKGENYNVSQAIYILELRRSEPYFVRYGVKV